MASASPSPKSPELTEKSKKYDRQLRLWGDHGQVKLENSSVCLINANATGTEILKSLVLPGCGNFTIVDGQSVTQEDIGNNFFLDAESLGKNRGETATRLLLELNPDVHGEAIEEYVENILKDTPNFFNRFSVVIASMLSEKNLIALSKNLWESNVPFVYVQCVGLVGWMRIQVTEHTIIESHPDNVLADLRLDVPFSELEHHLSKVTITGREDAIKTPWLVLYYKACEKFMNMPDENEKGENGNANIDVNERHPILSSGKNRSKFREFLMRYLRDFGLNESNEPFDEALKAVVRPTKIPSVVAEILQDPKATKPDTKFWVMCAALKDFVDANGGLLPVTGSIPDMTADSEKFISLQNVYREKAAKDAEDVLSRCQELVQQAGLQKVTFKGDEVKLFCKESHHLRVVRGQAFYEELTSAPNAILGDLAQDLEDCDADKMFYVMFRGILRFHNEFTTYPGLVEQDVEPDIIRLKGCLTKMLNEWNTSFVAKEDYIHEICRYGASEIPSIAAFIGGCAAHEAIKLITSQYVPLDNSFIYNAVNCSTSTFRVL